MPGALVEAPAGVVHGRAGAWLGIPYASASRWEAPRRLEPWAAPLDALRPGPPAPQPSRPISRFAHGETPPGVEDCLSLNVWTPRSGDGPWPVLVWSIGGGWTIGWTGSSIYDGAALAEGASAVVVVPTYRLGSLGWLCHPSLGANWGLLDHVAALEWVRDNIAAFGGDPARVTIGGQSAGAGNVADLLVSPLARGLFAQALMHSPPLPESGNDPARGARWAEDLAQACDVPDVSSLRDVAVDMIVAAHEALLTEPAWRGTRGAAWPAVVPATLPCAPLDAPDASLEVPVLIGGARDEATFLFRTGGRRLELDEAGLQRMAAGVTGLADPAAAVERHRAGDAEETLVRLVTEELFAGPARRWADAREAAGGRVFRFTVEFEAPDPRLAALHTIDVPLLFGTFRTSDVARGFVADTDAARRASATMQDAWGRYVHHGDPGWAAGNPFVVR